MVSIHLKAFEHSAPSAFAINDDGTTATKTLMGVFLTTIRPVAVDLVVRGQLVLGECLATRYASAIALVPATETQFVRFESRDEWVLAVGAEGGAFVASPRRFLLLVRYVDEVMEDDVSAT